MSTRYLNISENDLKITTLVNSVLVVIAIFFVGINRKSSKSSESITAKSFMKSFGFINASLIILALAAIAAIAMQSICINPNPGSDCNNLNNIAILLSGFSGILLTIFVIVFITFDMNKSHKGGVILIGGLSAFVLANGIGPNGETIKSIGTTKSINTVKPTDTPQS